MKLENTYITKSLMKVFEDTIFLNRDSKPWVVSLKTTEFMRPIFIYNVVKNGYMRAVRKKSSHC